MKNENPSFGSTDQDSTTINPSNKMNPRKRNVSEVTNSEVEVNSLVNPNNYNASDPPFRKPRTNVNFPSTIAHLKEYDKTEPSEMVSDAKKIPVKEIDKESNNTVYPKPVSRVPRGSSILNPNNDVPTDNHCNNNNNEESSQETKTEFPWYQQT